MKLYGFPPSPNTWKVRSVAAHIGLPLELALVDLSKGQQRTPEYLALNPTGRPPTRVDGDLVLWESWQLQHWRKEACEPLVFQRLVKKLLNMGPPDAAVLEKGTECFHR